MDRIMDSGSIDWGSTPHGRTNFSSAYYVDYTGCLSSMMSVIRTFFINVAMEYTFEICANSVESCLAAQEGGAHRVELCASMPEGGTTPSIGEVRLARRLLDIKLHVIIRPRGGDFVYSPLDLDIMEEDIRAVKAAGADGVVFGCLTPEAELDMPLCSPSG